MYNIGFRTWALGSNPSSTYKLHDLEPLLALLSPGVQNYKMGLMVVLPYAGGGGAKHKADKKVYGSVPGHARSSKKCELSFSDKLCSTCHAAQYQVLP